MSDENKKEIKIKMRVVAFSDLPKIKEISYKEIGVGNTNIKFKNKEKISRNVDPEELEREGNESIF